MKWVFALLLNLCVSTIVFAATLVDANQADIEALQQIKGIGIKTAQRIVQERQRGGAFASFEDLSARVKGIGKKRAKKLYENGLRVEGEHAKNLGSLQPASSISAGDKFVVHKHKKESFKPKHIQPRALAKGEYFLRPPKESIQKE